MIKVLDQTHDNLVAINVDIKLDQADYKKLNQLVDGALSKNRKANLYIEMGPVEGISPSAVWEDFKFDFKHYNNLDKIVVTGEEEWHKWMTNMSRIFTNAEVKFFEISKKDEAFEWLGVEEHAAH